MPAANAPMISAEPATSANARPRMNAEADDDRHAARPQSVDPGEHPRRERQADDDRRDQEPDGRTQAAGHVEHRDRRTRREARHDAQQHQPDDVVEHGRAEDQLRLHGAHRLEVRQHAGRDADGRGGECGADEQAGRRRRRRGVDVRVERREPERESQAERQGHSTRATAVAAPHPAHRAEVGLESDLEQRITTPISAIK
jgi:hypothetical protein